MNRKYLVKKFFSYIRTDGVSLALNRTFSFLFNLPSGANLLETIRIGILYLHSKYKKHPDFESSSGIIMIQAGALGDGITFIDAFRALANYCEEKGEMLTVVCREDSRLIYEKYALIKNINYLTYKNPLKADDLRALLEKICAKKYAFSLTGNSPLDNLFYSAINADFEAEREYAAKLTMQLASDSISYKNRFLPAIYKQFLLEFGVQDYTTGQIHFTRGCNQTSDKYILLCPESTDRAKSLNPDVIEKILVYLKSVAGQRIIISMTDAKRNYLSDINAICRNFENAEVSTGLDFEDYSRLIQNASCVIGCDSGSVHFAAAFGVPTVVLASQQAIGSFFPYNFDVKTGAEPVCIYGKLLNCSSCATRGSYLEHSRCRRMVEKGLSTYCISQIPMEDIYSAIDRVIAAEGITKELI